MMEIKVFTWSWLSVSMVCLSLALNAEIVKKEAGDDTNLWDDTLPSNREQNISGLSLGELDPGQLAAFERSNRNAILAETVQFARAMKSCEDIVVAVFKVADFVPPFNNDEQSKFWTETVNPILVRSLHQYVIARSVISESFGAIGDLVVVIQNVYEIVVRSHGSKKAIEIARKNIVAALNDLSECIVRVEQLNSNAITSFAHISEMIFDIIGPEAANFAKLKESFDERILQKRDEQQKLILQLGTKKGDVESFFYLIEVTSKHVVQTERDLQEAKKRKDELVQLNNDIQKIMQGIPRVIPNNCMFIMSGYGTYTYTCLEYSQRSFDSYIENPEWRYYEDIIQSRAARLQSMANDENAKQIAVKQLETDLAGYKAAYVTAKEGLDRYQITFVTDFQAAEYEIVRASNAKLDIDKNALATFEKIGLHGNVLVEALSQVRIFAATLQPGASAYSPFEAILKTIKALLEAPVDLLSGDEPSDVFLAAALLLEEVQFLADYTESAQQILKPNDDYDEQAIIQKLNKAFEHTQ